MASPRDLLVSAVEHHRAGRIGQAMSLTQEALGKEPNNADAHHLLGLFLAESKRPDEAVSQLKHSISLSPDNLHFRLNLAKVYRATGDFSAAADQLHRALDIDATSVPAHIGLAETFVALGQPNQAIRHYRTALSVLDSNPSPSAAQSAAQVWSTYARLLHALGKFEHAIPAFTRAIELSPNDASLYNDLGIALATSGDIDRAAECFGESARLDGNFSSPRANLAILQRDTGRLADSLGTATSALESLPPTAPLLNLLGNVLKDRADLTGAVACFRRAVSLFPNDPTPHDNLLYALLYHPDPTPKSVYEEHLRWAEQHERPLAAARLAHVNAKDPDRKLRLAYVSPDFRTHPLGLLIEPILAHHDHKRFTVVCYSDAKSPDALTEKIKSHADFFESTSALSDEQLAERIRRDEIDILVDLTNHMGGNRLLALARKPAPVQASYLAYPYTTGLESMDYLLTDNYLHPPDAPWHHTETLFRLPDSYWAYPVPADAPPVVPPPCLTTGQVTFGSLNNFCKVNAPLLDLWSRILARVPNSRLALLTSSAPDDDLSYARNLLASSGIDPDRISFHHKLPRREYLALYNSIDLILDPMPCTGHTTSLDALYMSVPIVTLPGPMPFSRATLSQLSCIGAEELIAASPEHYVTLASTLASDKDRLARYRATLRDRFLASPLASPERLAKNLESAYLAMWHAWCGEA